MQVGRGVLLLILFLMVLNKSPKTLLINVFSETNLEIRDFLSFSKNIAISDRFGPSVAVKHTISCALTHYWPLLY